MTENWIVPCNMKYFDVVSHFKSSSVVVWKNSFNMRAGDTAYIYLSAPCAEIKFKCRIVKDVVDEETLQKNAYAIIKNKPTNYFTKKVKYVQMELISIYPKGTFPLFELKKYGLGQVQIQARTNKNLQKYLDIVENNISETDNGGDDSGI